MSSAMYRCAGQMTSLYDLKACITVAAEAVTCDRNLLRSPLFHYSVFFNTSSSLENKGS